MKKILVISPHGDDAELAMGGTMDKLIKEGDKIEHLVFDREFKIREFGYHRQEILEKLIQARDRFKPDWVFCPATTDMHQDHQVVNAETIRAFKTNATILGYELPWNNIDQHTNLLVKLNKYNLEKKWKMLQAFPGQFYRPYFNKEFIISLATVRGIQCHAPYAESFEVIRWLIS